MTEPLGNYGIPTEPERMSQPKKTLSELLSVDGDSVFTLTEKQFYGIVKGWTHLSLMDKRSIFECIYITRSRPHTPASTSNLHSCTHKEIRNGVEFCHFYDSPTDPTAIRKEERERVLPNDEELKSLKQVVCFAIQQHLFDAERADNYYHKLKSLRGKL